MESMVGLVKSDHFSVMHLQLDALLKMIDPIEARLLIVTLDYELSQYTIEFKSDVLMNEQSARSMFHKVLGFANQFFFVDLAKVAREALVGNFDDYSHFRIEALKALKVARSGVHSLLIENRRSRPA